MKDATEAADPVAAILLRAADVMELGGLMRGYRGPRDNPKAPHCALGGLDVASYASWPYLEAAQHRLATVVRPLIPIGTYDKYNGGKENLHTDSSAIACWSNMVAKDAADVAARMREAAALQTAGQ